MSLQKQTRLADEVVIVFDGFIPEKLENLVYRFEKKLNIKLVKLEQNVGLAKALNAGLKVCKGELIARLDTDDYCRSDRLEIQEQYFLNNPEADVVGSFAQLIDFSGNFQGIRSNPINNNDIYKELWCCPLLHPSVMYRKIIIVNVGAYNPNLKRRQDYELWFRVAKQGGTFKNIDKPLIAYRYDRDTNKRQNPKIAFQQGIIGFKGTMSLRLGFVKSIMCFYPFFRSFLPSVVQHKLYFFMKKFDPRN
ncbi:glycosyltransferase [Vibrio neonatus]|nr:glycosyltransferase [Vibrio neonatus]